MSERIGAVSDGAAEDIIRSFTQLVCTEGHYKTLIEKYNSELNNGIVNSADAKAVEKHLELLNDAIDELSLISELRRSLMLRLMNDFTPNKDYWCIVKHLAAAEYNAFEAYQATDNDGELMTTWLDIRARFVHAVTRWLGTEITECSSCLTDILRGKKEE